MKNLDIPEHAIGEAPDSNTGAEENPPPKRARGRPKGSKNKISASSRAVLEEWGPKITDAACRWAVGKPIVRINSKGQREKVYPSGDQMQTSQKLVLERLVAVRKHAEIVGKDGADLIPKEHEPRDLARTILHIGNIFKSAELEEAPPEPPAEREPLLLTRDTVIELDARDVKSASDRLHDGAQGEGSGSTPTSWAPGSSPDEIAAGKSVPCDGGEPGYLAGSSPPSSDPHATQRYPHNGASIEWNKVEQLWHVRGHDGQVPVRFPDKGRAKERAINLNGPDGERHEFKGEVVIEAAGSLKAHVGPDNRPSDFAAPQIRHDQLPFPKHSPPKAVRKRPK